MNERWKAITELPLYEVSDRGRVRSWHPHHKTKARIRAQPIMVATQAMLNGYRVVVLRYMGNRKAFYVHRLVAKAFVEGEDSLHLVAHLDGNRANNNHTNLKWCTQKENASHMIGHGTKLENENHPSTKMSDSSVRAIIKMKELGFATGDIAWLFEVSPALVCDYVSGRARFRIVKKRTRRPHIIEENVIRRQK